MSESRTTETVGAYHTARHHVAHTVSGLLSDWMIQELAENDTMITPFYDHQIRTNSVISYGLSSYGYDARVATEYRLFEPFLLPNMPTWSPAAQQPIDPKTLATQANAMYHHVGENCIIPPHGFALAHTVEYFKLPSDVLAICLGKSTYARVGLIVNCTPLEPGWEGQVTLELSNTTPMPIRVHSMEGITQFLFFRGATAARETYASRGGKYQNQTGVTLPRVEV